MNETPDNTPPAASGDEDHIPGLTVGLLEQLSEAIEMLRGDSEWIIRALTEAVLAMRPVSDDGLTDEQKNYLITSGDFTPDELSDTLLSVRRGSLQLNAATAFLSDLYGTLSLADAAAYLRLDEQSVRAAAEEGDVHSVEIGGRLRFPSWQFSAAHDGRVLPGLPRLIASMERRWGWQAAASFMRTPQSELIATGRQTPLEWLRNGGDSEAVCSIVENEFHG